MNEGANWLNFGLIWMVLFWSGLMAVALWLIGLLFPVSQSRPDETSLLAENKNETGGKNIEKYL